MYIATSSQKFFVVVITGNTLILTYLVGQNKEILWCTSYLSNPSKFPASKFCTMQYKAIYNLNKAAKNVEFCGHQEKCLCKF